MRAHAHNLGKTPPIINSQKVQYTIPSFLVQKHVELSYSIHEGGWHPQGNPPARHVRAVGLGDHPDAVDDGTHTDAQGAARAVCSHVGQVSLGIESYGLGLKD